MKKTGLLLTLIFLFTLFSAGCFRQEGSSIPPVSSRQTVSSQTAVSSMKPQTASSVPADSQAAVSAESNPHSSESQVGPVIPIQTDSEKYNVLFKKNPIDAEYIKESKTAISTVDMINLSDKFANVWQKEIEHAYSELEKYLKTDSSYNAKKLEAEQKKWEDGKDAAIRLIGQEAQSTGGTMAQVDATSKVMDFYRSRAAQIYRELYNYDQNFSYAYSDKK
jgi:uncharacterized protein YecT (DUF1311 family)